MPKLYRVEGEPNLLIFTCPACEYGHPFWVGPASNGESHPVWSWNGSMDAPTFSPSLLVHGGGESPRCHSFVTDGNIAFCGDSTHKLAGQTVPIPEVEP
jgi:hypothetical protein